MVLQKFLNQDPATVIAQSGSGAPGFESATFGPRTKLAVIKFQEKYAADILTPNGLLKGSGIVGPATRAKLKALCPAETTGGVSQMQPVAGNFLTVADPGQPSTSLAPSFALWVPFTNFSLSAGDADVTVESVTIERAGLGRDSAFESINLADEDGNQIGGDYRFRADHRTTVTKPFVIPAGTEKTFTVMANMNELTDYDGQMPQLHIVEVKVATGTSLLGPLPIRGAFHTLNSSLIIGTAHAERGSFDPTIDRTQYITDTGIRFSGIRVTADSREDLELSSITWRQNGTASPADIKNVETVVDGIAYPTENDWREYTTVFSPSILVPKGNTVDIHLRGDLGTTGSNRTVKFDIDSSGDVWLVGKTYGFGVYVIPQGNTDVSGNSVFITSDGTTDGDEGRPFYSGSVLTISPGAATSISR